MPGAVGASVLLGGGMSHTGDGQHVGVVGPNLFELTSSVVGGTGRCHGHGLMAGGGVGGGVVAGQLVHGKQAESNHQDREPQDDPRLHRALEWRRS